MRFVTVATHEDPRMEVFDASCRHFGIKVDRLGQGLEYKNHASKWIWLKEYLAGLPSDEIVLMTDCHDAFFLAGAEEIEAKFIAAKHPFLISGEQNFNLDIPFIRKWATYRRYAKGRAPYRYLNSGGWIARAGVARDVLDRFDGSLESEQGMFNLFHSFNPGVLCIDDRNEIFTTTGGRAGLERSDYAVRGDRIFNRITGSSPCIAHFPGGNLRGANRLLSQIFYLPEYEVSSSDGVRETYSGIKNRLTDLTVRDNYLFHLGLNTLLALAALIAIVFATTSAVAAVGVSDITESTTRF